MKIRKLNDLTEKAFLLSMAISVLLFFNACSKKNPFLTSSVVPAAQGSVNVKRDKNANYTIDLNVIRLADPSRLDPPKNTYMVWIETEQEGVKSIGRLKTSSSLFSKVLNSSLQTVTSYKPTRIFITAEDDLNTRYPGQVILSTAPF